MTLHFFEELKLDSDRSQENPFAVDAAKKQPFFTKGNIIEEKIESSDDLVRESIFTE